MSEPEWLQEGAEVALFTPASYIDGGMVHFKAIVRLTKTRVVLDDGSYVSRKTMCRHGGTWDPQTDLVSRDDERVVKALGSRTVVTPRRWLGSEMPLRRWPSKWMHDHPRVDLQDRVV